MTSPAVLNELAGGTPEPSLKRLALVRDLPLLSVEVAITEIDARQFRPDLLLQIMNRHHSQPSGISQ